MGNVKGEERSDRPISRIFEDQVAPRLRQRYAAVAEEPLPSHLLDLLRELEESERRAGDLT